MPLVKLSDAELRRRAAAARPLPIDLRDPFLHAVSRELYGRAEVSPGVLHRVCRERPRQFFSPPNLSRSNDTNKPLSAARSLTGSVRSNRACRNRARRVKL